jgi:hypothetical protein
MTSVRTRTCVVGAALTATAGLLTAYGDLFGADLPAVALFGLAAGAVLGLVPDRAPAARVAGFAVGFLATWLAYALRAAVLPDIPVGRGIAAVLVLSAITAVATATAGRVPLWSGLLGAVSLAGVYEATYTTTPAAFASESTTAATTVLLVASLGFLLTVLASTVAAPAAGAHRSAPEPSHDDDGYDDGLDDGLEVLDDGAPATGSALPAPVNAPTPLPRARRADEQPPPREAVPDPRRRRCRCQRCPGRPAARVAGRRGRCRHRRRLGDVAITNRESVEVELTPRARSTRRASTASSR